MNHPDACSAEASKKRRLRILLSAYACEPNKGSEPGIGWRWALGLAHAGHEVWVITRANNAGAIEHALAGRRNAGLQFIYYDLPGWARGWKRGARGVRTYYVLWEWGRLPARRGGCAGAPDSTSCITSPSGCSATRRSWRSSACRSCSGRWAAAKRRPGRCARPSRCAAA